jgi:lipopolysaccharide/colanic/teichoic acid biosynthesis glycosyltransferase
MGVAVIIKSLRFRILVADLCWALMAMGLSYGLRYGQIWRDPSRIPVSALIPFVAGTLVSWSVLSFWLRLDGFRGGWTLPAVLSQLFPAVACLMALLFTGAYLARLYTSRLLLGYFGFLLFLGLVTVRLGARYVLASRYRSGTVRKAVIVGSGPIASEIAKKIDSHPEMLWEVAGFLCPAESAANLDELDRNERSISVRSVGIVDLLQARAIDDLILAVSKPGHPEISDLVSRCLNRGIAVSVVPQPYELYLSQPKLVDLDGLPLLKLEGLPAVQGAPFWKRMLDLGITVLLLPIAGPVIITAAAWLKVRKGRGFRAENRCGQFGEPFSMYRLNSDRNAVSLPFLESVMQYCSITELPQIINVLRGDMSLVGPRPEGPEKIRHYSDWHRRRLSIKPGITGLAQVHGLRDQNSSEDKTRYDLQYILHRSPFLDISLLLQTLWTLAVRLLNRNPAQARLPMERAPMHVQTVFEESLSRAHSSQSGSD